MRQKKPLFMENTEIPAERTAAEISACLIAAGATQIATDYDGGQITGLRWTMRVSGRDVLFAMPARVEPVYQTLKSRQTPGGRGRPSSQGDLRAKAVRVAWRQLFRWTQAQMAMIECGMAETSEVFFAYIQTGRGGLFEVFKAGDFKAIAPPEVEQ